MAWHRRLLGTAVTRPLLVCQRPSPLAQAILQDDAFKGQSLEDLDAVAHFFASQDPVVPAPVSNSGKKKQRR